MIVDGTLIIEDETGQKKTGKVGDLFYFNKGTTVTFTTPDYGIGFFVGQMMKQTKGKGNPALINDLLKDKLEK